MPPGRQKSDDKREVILAAASVEFAERDFHQVLMDEVSARAGVGKGTLYRYFPTKEELFIATVFRGVDEFHQQFLRVFTEKAPIEKILTDAVARVLEYFAGRGEVLSLVQRYEHRLPRADAESWNQRRDETRRAIADALEREAAGGRLRGIEPRLGADLLLGMVRAAIGGALPDRAPVDVARDVVGVFLDGMRGERTPQRRTALRAVHGARGGES
ncbi:MAG: TetR/AcrR family transcriptional regulator [Alphaproteobacteria bacterium]